MDFSMHLGTYGNAYFVAETTEVLSGEYQACEGCEAVGRLNVPLLHTPPFSLPYHPRPLKAPL